MTRPPDDDLHFYFDPVCPFAWQAAEWVRSVQAQRSYSVRWRFLSLRLLNAELDYDARFPVGYDAGHGAGLRLLRVAARVRAEHGNDAVARLYQAIGARIFAVPTDPAEHDHGYRGTRRFVEPLLAEAGFAAATADALDDDQYDAQIGAETHEAVSLVGRDVGTPIVHVRPPHGVAFFGPVISRVPSAEQAGPLWDHVVALASFPGFAELKRTLRERPQLASMGIGLVPPG